MKPLSILTCLAALATLAGLHAQDPILKDTYADVASDTRLNGHHPEVSDGPWKTTYSEKITIIRSGDDAFVSNGEARSATATVPMVADAGGGFTIAAKVRSASQPVNDHSSWISLLVKNEAPGSLFDPGSEYIGVMLHSGKSGFSGYTIFSSPKDNSDPSPVYQIKLKGAAARQTWNEDEFNDVVFSCDPAKHTVSLSVNGNEIWANEPVWLPEDVPATGLYQFQIAWNGGYDDTGCTDGRVGPVTVTPLP